MVKFHSGDESQLPVRLTGLDCVRESVATTTLRGDLAWDFVEVARPAGSLTAQLTYATDLFDRRTAEELRDGLVCS